MNFKGLNIDFQIIVEPIMLIRYLSHCETDDIFPYELGSTYSKLKSQNSSTSLNTTSRKTNTSPEPEAVRYMKQSLAESFQLKSKNKICEANVYLHPPSEHDSPQMFAKDLRWEKVLKNPVWIKFKATKENEKWKYDYLDTVPSISLLICNSTGDSICGNEKDVKKWIASVVSQHPEILKVFLSILIWEYSSFTLKTLCPYCDPCDSLKTIPVQSKIIPNARHELETILQESRRLNPDPYSVEVILVTDDMGDYGDLRSKQTLMKHIQMYRVDSEMFYLFVSADEHLTSLLLPKSTNISFVVDSGSNLDQWENVFVDACSPLKAIESHPVFRPAITRSSFKSRSLFQESRLVTFINQLRFVSCHKKQMHWTSQLLELISPFDTMTWLLIFSMSVIVSWIVKISIKSNNTGRNQTVFDVMFLMCTRGLEQSIKILDRSHKTTKVSFYCCVFVVPITWLYLSTLYKGDNVTRLTADPPLIQFDTFEMLEEYQFSTYSRRYNLQTFYNAESFNISELEKLEKEYGSVQTHETFPVVSALWYRLMFWLKNLDTFKLGLNYLKNEISKQMWKYINNSAMLPDYGQEFMENVPTILNVHMSKCNKSAFILRRQSAIQLHTLLKQMGKPSFFGKDIILERFWGYKFSGYFPPTLIFRARYLFEAGVFEWWQKHFEYSLVLKLNVHGKRLMASLNQNVTSGNGGSKSAVAVLSLIPGVGLLFSLIVFICVEKRLIKTLHKKVSAFFSKAAGITLKLLEHIWKSAFKWHVELDNIISINVQPKK